ncbi:MAG: helix-turn-helix domain-containing protein [Hyphomonadaceae bacterium]|nr:helix-turn-helix domain-containing protein [Hyphomonadaceae bacterium]
MHSIGAVSKATGLKIPTIRFYEDEGIIAAPERGDNGRRQYTDADIRRLAFVRHARSLGFELDDVRSLLDLCDDPNRSCADADRIARTHLAGVEGRIAQLTALKKELVRIVRSCAGGKSATCRVIESLSSHDACSFDHTSPQARAGKLGQRQRRR